MRIRQPKRVREDMMVEWLLMDHHLGMHSWAKETGADYDTKQAKRLMLSAASKIFSLTGPVQQAVIVLGGDSLHLHADNRSATTEKSGHHLDVDSRLPYAVDAISEGIVGSVDLALAQAREV